MPQRSSIRSRTLPGAGPAWATAALAIVAPELLGGATDGTLLVVLLLVSATCIWTTLSLRYARRSLEGAPLAAVGAALLSLWTLLQSLHLPCSLVNWAQPERAELQEQLRSLHVLESVRCSFSLAPGASRVALATGTALTALLLAATALSRTGHREILAKGIALSSISMAFVAVGHLVFDADRVFGLYTPRFARPGLLLAPLLNANHLAGLLALGLPLCIAYCVRAKRLDERLIWLAGVFLVLATGLLTLSRAGAVALVGGGTFFFAFRTRSKHQTNRRTVVLAVAPVAAAAALAASFSVDLLAREFDTPDFSNSKITNLQGVLQLWLKHPLLGIGRGALPDLSPTVLSGNARLWYAESLPVQWLVDWGAPICFLSLGLFASSLVTVRVRSNTGRALATGALALLAQNFLDFSLELIGIAVPFTIALGGLLGKEHHAGPLLSIERTPRPKLRISLGILTALSVATTLAAVPFLTTRSRANLQRVLLQELDSKTNQFAPTLAVAFDAFPLDPNFVVLGAAHAVRRGSALAPAWLNLAMARAPGWPAPHVHASYWLETHNRLDQAAIEIGLIFERHLEGNWDLSCKFVQRHPVARLAWSALPDHSHARQRIAEHLAGCLMLTASVSESEQFVREAIDEFPYSAELRLKSVDLSLKAGAADEALARASRMLTQMPNAPESGVGLIKALLANGRADEALRAYDDLLPVVRLDREVLLQSLSAAAKSSPQRIEGIVERLMTNHARDSDRRAAISWYASVAYEEAGNLPKALSLAQAAYDLQHESGALERVHALALRTGVPQLALRAAAELCHLRHRGTTYCGDAPR